MLIAFGAASAALDAVKSLTSSNTSAESGGFSQASADLFGRSVGASASGGAAAAAGSTGLSQISPATMSALLTVQGQSPTPSAAPTSPASALQSLFSQIDANGDGQITKSEFENALGAGGTNIAAADHVFNQLDKNGDGTVSLGELKSALQGSGDHGHIGGSGGGTSGSSTDPLLQALQGGSSTSVTNSDGSTTTSLTYADGSKVTMTSAAPTASSSAASSSYNFIEQMIQREAKAISLSTAPLSVNA